MIKCTKSSNGLTGLS